MGSCRVSVRKTRVSKSRLWAETKNQEDQLPNVTAASAVTLSFGGIWGKPKLVASTQKVISKLRKGKRILGFREMFGCRL